MITLQPAKRPEVFGVSSVKFRMADAVQRRVAPRVANSGGYAFNARDAPDMFGCVQADGADAAVQVQQVIVGAESRKLDDLIVQHFGLRRIDLKKGMR